MFRTLYETQKISNLLIRSRVPQFSDQNNALGQIKNQHHICKEGRPSQHLRRTETRAQYASLQFIPLQELGIGPWMSIPKKRTLPHLSL